MKCLRNKTSYSLRNFVCEYHLEDHGEKTEQSLEDILTKDVINNLVKDENTYI